LCESAGHQHAQCVFNPSTHPVGLHLGTPWTLNAPMLNPTGS
jgi:hypothetical protein